MSAPEQAYSITFREATSLQALGLAHEIFSHTENGLQALYVPLESDAHFVVLSVRTDNEDRLTAAHAWDELIKQRRMNHDRRRRRKKP